MIRFFWLRTQPRAFWKWALSFRSRDWKLEDYPILVREVEPDPNSAFANNPRFKTHRWVASITNWNVSGFGNSKEDALSDLQAAFATRKASLAEQARPLPRPGTDVPLEFASQERVDAHQELKEDFIQRVLGFDWAFISDESSLWDFHSERTNDALLAKIRDVYDVSVDDIESAKICEILDRIAEAKKSE